MNGDFECQPFSACGWEEYDNTVWGILITPDCIDPTRPGCAAYLETMEWGGFWDAQFYQRVSLEPGARYRLEFEAKANRLTRSITVALVPGGPMTDTRSEDDLGFIREFYLAPSWEWHTATFTAEESDEDAAFVFAFSAEEPGFFMDNVALACALE